MDPNSSRSNFERGVDILRRRGLWIVLCCVLAAAAAFAYSKHQPKKYTATASLVFKSNQLTQQIAGFPTNLPAQASQNSDVRLVQVGDMAEKTASRLANGLTAQKVSASLSIAPQGETSVVGEASTVDVSASATSPILAAAIANTYAEQFVAEQQESNHRFFASALATVSKQLAALPAKQKLGTAGVDLQNRAEELKTLTELQYGGVQLGQRAVVPTVPSSPRTLRNTLIGGALGILLGLGLVLLLERLDPRVREPEELETVYGSPLLGVIPESKALSLRERPPTPDDPFALPPTEAEAFDLTLAHLRSFNFECDLRAVLVTSAAPAAGTTTVSLHLAEAAARSGSRTLLLELDLRRPTLANDLGIQSAPGLRDVLTDAIAIGDATQSIDLSPLAGSGGTGPTLDVITAGAAGPSHTVDLVKSHTLDATIEQMKSTYDLILVDTPSLMAVPDAFPLLRKVDGVLVVSRIGRDRRDAAQRLRQTLDRSAASLLGVVANRLNLHGRPKRRDSHSYDYVESDKSSTLTTSTIGIVSSEETRPLTRA